MQKFLWLLILTLLGCEPPLSEDDMAKKYPNITDDRRQPAVPRVATITPRTGGWSGDNQLGYQAKYGPDRRNTQTILKMDEWGPPEIWTISLFVDQKFESFDGFNISARINFGVGGSTQVIEMDWLNGAQISLPMNAVNVEALFESVDVTTEGAGLSVGVQLARGTRGGTQPPIKTLAATRTFAGGGSIDIFELPLFAKNAVLVPTGTLAGELTSFFADTNFLIVGTGNSIGTVTTANAQGSRAVGMELRVPVVAGTRFVVVRNGGAAYDATLYCELEG
jgi:hypothetical protein